MQTRKFLLFLVYCIVLIPALPPVFVPLFEPFTFGKTELFEITVELMLLLLLFGVRLRTVLWSNPVKPVVLLFIAVSLSTALGAHPLESFWGSSARNDGLFTLAHFFLFFAILANTLAKQEWLKLFRFSLFASAFVSLYALLQYFGFPFVRASDGAIFGTIGNSAYLAAYLLFHIFLAIFIAHGEPSERKIPLWQALALFEIAIVFMTHNRAGILGLVFGLLLFGGSVLFMKIRSTAIRNRSVAIGVAATVIILAIYAPAIADYARADLTAQSRLFAWNASLTGIMERPFIGHGANQFERAYTAYAKQAAIATPTQESFDKPHNIILEMLFSYGALGLVAYIMLWFALLASVRKRYAGPERFVWYGMFTAYFISLLFLFDTFSSLLLFFLFLAFFASREEHLFRIQENLPLLASGAIFLCFISLFFLFHFKPLYSAYWARALLVNAESTGTLDARMQTEALRYDSFNSSFIRNAILYTAQNLKR